MGTLVVLYLLPVMIARSILWIRPIKNTRIPLSSPEYFTWWILLNLQMLFCRLPFLEECLRCVPTLYSNWLRLWGAKIGKYTYWAAGLRILDRSFLNIGDGVVFGAGVRLNSHVVTKNSSGDLELQLADIVIKDRAIIGGYSLLTAGTVVEQDEVTKAILQSPPFSTWVNGKRLKNTSEKTEKRTFDAN
ncbi:MAG: hypothetical protein GY702_24545 [Desulfobulbaceae bacterium]|nr:hypothetical protein [Desulfobulbaceae bacterium]